MCEHWGVRIRVAGRWVAAAAISLGLVLAASPATAGTIVTGDGTDISTGTQRAVISWDGETETVDLELHLSSDTGTAGFIFPTPSKAEVSVGDPSLFDRLDAATAPTGIVEDDWWGRESESTDAASSIVRAPIDLPEPTVIKATNKKGLNNWLKEHEFVLSDAATDAVASYASQGWSFSMVTLSAADAFEGALEPVRFTFATDEVVYPLRLASATESALSYRFYVIDDHRTEFMQSPKTSRELNAARSVVWAGSLAGTGLESLGPYLTVTDIRFDTPATQVSSDIAIVDAPADDQLIPSIVVYHPIELLSMPLGWIIVVWGGIGLLFAAGYLANRFRAK